jgi:hypothetical protein
MFHVAAGLIVGSLAVWMLRLAVLLLGVLLGIGVAASLFLMYATIYRFLHTNAVLTSTSVTLDLMTRAPSPSHSPGLRNPLMSVPRGAYIGVAVGVGVVTAYFAQALVMMVVAAVVGSFAACCGIDIFWKTGLAAQVRTTPCVNHHPPRIPPL